MTSSKERIYKFVILTVLMVVFTISSGCTELGFKRTPLSGEIIALSNPIVVNQGTPLVLKIPTEIDALHKEMWEVLFVDKEGQETLTSGEILENIDLDETFLESEIEILFKDSPVPILNKDPKNEGYYSPRVAIFTPTKKGVYKINIMGYYKTTSPRPVTSLEVIVVEE